MTNKFSSYLRSKKPLIKKLIDELSQKYPYVSVLGTDVFGVSIYLDKSSTTLNPSSITESGFVIKIFGQNNYHEYSIHDIEDDQLPKIIETLDALANAKSNIPSVDALLINEEEMTESFERRDEGKYYSPESIIAILKEQVLSTLDSSPLIVNARAGIESTEVSKMYLSNKKNLEQYYTWNNVNTFVLARQNSNTKYGYEGFGDASLENCINQLKEQITHSAKIAIDLLDSTLPIPGIYDVITDPSISGLIAHEAFGHGVEMDMFVKDRALAKEYMHKRVASPLVSMHDGAKAAHSTASYFFDDDGVLAQDTKIIDQGILINGISDALSAMQLKISPSGNGRRQSYKRKSYTRMTNTFFVKGNDKLDDMIKSIKKGYLISETNNGMEDPKNWGIQCTAHYGREIIDGAFTGKIISPVVMSGYVIDLLNSITMVSDDFKIIGSGSCGKGYKEWVRVSDGGPYMKARVKIG